MAARWIPSALGRAQAPAKGVLVAVAGLSLGLAVIPLAPALGRGQPARHRAAVEVGVGVGVEVARPRSRDDSRRTTGATTTTSRPRIAGGSTASARRSRAVRRTRHGSPARNRALRCWGAWPSHPRPRPRASARSADHRQRGSLRTRSRRRRRLLSAPRRRRSAIRERRSTIRERRSTIRERRSASTRERRSAMRSCSIARSARVHALYSGSVDGGRGWGGSTVDGARRSGRRVAPPAVVHPVALVGAAGRAPDETGRGLAVVAHGRSDPFRHAATSLAIRLFACPCSSIVTTRPESPPRSWPRRIWPTSKRRTAMA